jgi:hypothetical protein
MLLQWHFEDAHVGLATSLAMSLVFVLHGSLLPGALLSVAKHLAFLSVITAIAMSAAIFGDLRPGTRCSSRASCLPWL